MWYLSCNLTWYRKGRVTEEYGHNKLYHLSNIMFMVHNISNRLMIRWPPKCCCFVPTEMMLGPDSIKRMTSYRYGKSHCEDKTIWRPSYLHNGISYTGKMTSLYWIRALVAATGDYCRGETFHAICNSDQIIVITYARYGRMRLGRCLSIDYGHYGCDLNVLPIMDAWCSGRRRCRVRVSDVADAINNTCSFTWRSYLSIDYQCYGG